MSSEFRRIYPGQGRVLFDGGLNSKYERSIIDDNESPDCANVVFSAGSVATRQGVQKVNSFSIANVPFDGLYTRRANDNSETMIAFVNTHMWTLGATTFVTVPSAQSIFTAGQRVCAAQFNNYMFIGNGGITPYKWNGTEFTRQGVYPPTVTAAVASNGVGALTSSGQYQYKLTNVNSALIESNVGPVSSTFVISTTSGQNTISNIPVAPTSFGVNTRRLYRNANGSATFKLVGTIADNTTTTFSDNIADASLGAIAPTDNGVPPIYSTIIYHQNRLFMNDVNNPNVVWYTDITGGVAAPFTVPSTNFFKVGDNSSDLVKAFGVYENAVVVFCEKSIWINYMQDATPSNWKQVKARSPHGSKSPFAIVDYDNKLLFPAFQNNKLVGYGALKGDVADTTTALLTVFSAGSELKSDRIEPEIFNLQESYVGNFSGIIYKNKAYFAITYGANITANNRVHVFDFSIEDVSKRQEAAWAPWTGLNVAQFTVYNGNIYYASSDSTGYVYQMESGLYNDAGLAINSYYWTKEYSGSKEEYNLEKDFRYTNLLLDTSGAYYMDVIYRVDSDSGGGQGNQVNLDPGGTQWGVMTWGVSFWGGGTTQKEVRIYFGTARGKRIQLKFSNQNKVNQRFKIHGMNFAYNVKGLR